MLLLKLGHVARLATLAWSQSASIPPEVQSVLLTAIPPASLAEFVDSTKVSSIASDFAEGRTPAWYASLPESIKSYLTFAGSINAAASSTASTSTFSSQSTPSSTSSTATPTSAPPQVTPIVTVTSQPTPSTDGPRRNNSWIAAAVVVPIVFLIAVAALIFFIRRHRRHSKTTSTVAPGQDPLQAQHQRQLSTQYPASVGDPHKSDRSSMPMSELHVPLQSQGHIPPQQFQGQQQTYPQGQYQYPAPHQASQQYHQQAPNYSYQGGYGYAAPMGHTPESPNYSAVQR